MGDYRIVVNAVGGHGCDRLAKDGEVRKFACGSPSCPDCRAADFVNKLRADGGMVASAELIHWPKDSPSGASMPEIRDNLLTGKRSGSF